VHNPICSGGVDPEEVPPSEEFESPAPEQDDPIVGSEGPGADEVSLHIGSRNLEPDEVSVGSRVIEPEEVPPPVSPGNSEPKLRSSMVGAPFTDLQQDIIYDQVKTIWLSDMDMYRENNHYVSYVLLLTIFIRIYQVFMGLSSFKEAERRINNAKASLYHDSPNTSSEMIV
jgi:hypothetical protein